MISRLKNYGIEVQAIEQPLDLSVPENLLILGVYLSLPDIDNRRRSMKITEGVRAAKAAGRWLGPAPYGYKSFKGDLIKAVLFPNEKAAIIKKIFLSLYNGEPQSEIRHGLKKKGHYFSESTFSSMIRNKVYAGQIYVTGNTSSEGYYVKGLHEPIISVELFEKVQDILAGNVRSKKKVNAKCFREELAFRGLLVCDNCEHSLTGSASTSKSGKKHNYYHCNNCGMVRIRAEEVHNRIEDIFEEISIKKNPKSLYDSILKKIIQTKAAKRRSPEKLEDEIRQAEFRIRNTEDNLADGKIDVPTFNNSINRYKNIITALRTELAASTDSNFEYNRYLRKGIDLLSNMKEFYAKSDIHLKRRLLCSTFPDNLIFSRKNCRTPTLNKAILLIMSADKGFSKQKTDVLFKNLTYTGTVESIGVEPTTSCMPCKRSSQLS